MEGCGKGGGSCGVKVGGGSTGGALKVGELGRRGPRGAKFGMLS